MRSPRRVRVRSSILRIVAGSMPSAVPISRRVELGAVAQAHDRALALGQLRQRDQERAPPPRAIERVCRIGSVVGRVGQFTRGGELGTAAAEPPARRVDGDGRDPGREARVGTRRVLVQRRQHRQHRILGHVLGIGVTSQHPADRAKHAVDVLHVQRLAGAGVTGPRLFDEAQDRILGERLGIAVGAASSRRRRATRAAMPARGTASRQRSRVHLCHVADRPDRRPEGAEHRGEDAQPAGTSTSSPTTMTGTTRSTGPTPPAAAPPARARPRRATHDHRASRRTSRP